MRELQVIVRGTTMSGKSRLAATIAHLLKEYYPGKVELIDEEHDQEHLARLVAHGPVPNASITVTSQNVNREPSNYEEGQISELIRKNIPRLLSAEGYREVSLNEVPVGGGFVFINAYGEPLLKIKACFKSPQNWRILLRGH